MLHKTLPLLRHIQGEQNSELNVEAGIRGMKISYYLLGRGYPFFCIHDSEYVLVSFSSRSAGVQLTEADIEKSILDEDDRVYWYFSC